MKFQIDTTQKTIKIEEEVNLGELFEKLEIMFPNQLWKEYKLEVSVITNWTNPIIITNPPTYPYYPTTQPYYLPYWTITSDGQGTSQYNVQF